MSLATIFQLPRDQEELRTWSFSHTAHHRDINRRVFEIQGVRLDEYVLDPYDVTNPGNWVALHQVMHQQMDKALNIRGYDLSQLDWTDDDGVISWFVSHSNEHYQAGAILGLG